MILRPAHNGRRGLSLVPALACLVVVVLFCVLLVRQVSNHRAVVRLEERRVQAEWLAESGLARAAARLGAEPGYAGETWELAPADLGGQPGLVRITVEPVDGRADARRVRVEADFPRDGTPRARAGKTLTVNLGPEPKRPGGAR